MAINVMTWVWNHSRSRHGARLVLLAIADSASSDGGSAFPSIAELMRKSNLGERAVQTALSDLAALGELHVDRNAGPKGCNRYRVIMTTPAGSAPPADNAPPQNLRGSCKCGESPQVTPDDPAGSAPPQDLHPPAKIAGDPAESAPVTVLKVKTKNSPTESSSPPPPGTPAKPANGKPRAERGTRIPDDFTVTDAMAQWGRDNCPLLIAAGLGRRETEKFTDYFRSASTASAVKRDWTAAWRNWMRRAEDDLAKRPGAGTAGPRPSTTDRAVADAQALKARLAGGRL